VEEAESPPRQPLFLRLPPVVVALVGAIVAIELLFQLAAAGLVGGGAGLGWRLAALERWAFSAPHLDLMLARGEYPPEALLRFLTCGFLHANAFHAGFAAVLVLALGKGVSDHLSAAAAVAIMGAGLVAGALLWWAAAPGGRLLFGAYPGIYALIGAYAWSLWSGGRGRERRLALRLVLVLAALQLGLRLVEDPGEVWIAEIGGFMAGSALAPLVAPGACARLGRLGAILRARR
jgi:membrane associated rhomboid family serine protease